jgi:flagellar protein FlgJ
MEPDKQKRLAQVAGIAVRLEAETGLPAQLLVAQWAIESQWGAKPAGHANYFGIKKAGRHEKCCTVTTREVIQGKTYVLDLEFADYDSLEDSCRDYAWLITHGDPYRDAWTRYQQDKRLRGLVPAVACVYATAPEYAELASRIAEQGNVTQAIERARGPLPEAA